jgi:hypothetical protein
LHDITVEPFELARHRGHRLDVEGALGRALVGDGRAERHHYGVRHTDDLPPRWKNRSNRGLKGLVRRCGGLVRLDQCCQVCVCRLCSRNRIHPDRCNNTQNDPTHGFRFLRNYNDVNLILGCRADFDV